MAGWVPGARTRWLLSARLSTHRVVLAGALLFTLGTFAAPSGLASAATGSEVLAVGHDGAAELGLGFQGNIENLAATMPKLKHVVQMAIGFNFGLAVVEEEGTRHVVSWGENNYGQLGIGSRTATKPPGELVTVKGLAGASEVAVDAAGTHAIALKEGKVFTWGITQVGESGNGYPTPEAKQQEHVKPRKVIVPQTNAPEEVLGLSGVKQIVARGTTDYALLNTGEVEAWGENVYGTTGPNVKQGKECAETATAAQFPCLCKSENSSDVTVPCTTRPVLICTAPCHTSAPLKGVTAIAAAEAAAFAYKGSEHQLVAWGTNQTGDLGAGAAISKYNPFPLPVGLPAGELQQIVPGNHHVLVLIGGKVYGWGNNASGAEGVFNDLLGEEFIGGKWQPRAGLHECGNKSKCFTSPVELPLSGFGPISSLGAGKADSFIVTTAGDAYGWGNNQYGRLGVSQWLYTATTAEAAKKEQLEEVVSGPKAVLGTESSPKHPEPVTNVKTVIGSEQRTAILLDEGVAAHAPAIATEWTKESSDTLTVTWRYKWPNAPGTGVAYKVRVCVEHSACQPTKELNESTRTVTFGGLVPHTKYEVSLKWFYDDSRRNKVLKQLEAP
ncbi:MAG TPA: fibronectin type III domain-containing protein [Gemmatimonadales bacterium]|nr:fibronectin type III domain-containing protein [Gemmatimonadales bacterium]